MEPLAWQETVATIGAWSPAATYRPVIEQRLWRASGRGQLRHTLAVVLHDPLDQLDDLTAVQEVRELLRPISERQPLAPVSGRSLDLYRKPVINHLAELADADPFLPEGGDAFEGLFSQLVTGLAGMPGRVGLSMLVAPARDLPASGRLAAASGADERPDAGTPARRVEFRLRIFAEFPLLAAVLARAEALCLASRPTVGHWQMALDRTTIQAARMAVAEASVEPWTDAAPASTVNPRIAALTLSLVSTSGGRARTVHGRPVGGRLPAAGAALGKVVRPDGRQAIWRLDWAQRRLHVLVAGSTGCGKTTTILRLALDDLQEGRAVVLVDPHGDVASELAAHVPPDRLVHIDPRQAESDPLDLLDADPGRATAHLMSAVQEVWPADWAGPTWNRAISITMRGLHASTLFAEPATLADVERFITDSDWRDVLIGAIPDARLRYDAQHESEMWKHEKPGHNGGPSLLQYVSSKFTPLTQGPGRQLFSTIPRQPLESDLRRGAVIVAALPVGRLGRETTRLAARMFLTRLTSAIAAQGDYPEEDRKPVSVFCDEAHLMTGTALTGLFAQARKFSASIHVCVQALSALGPQLDEILTNAQTQLLGRLNAAQAGYLLDRAGVPTVRVLPTLPKHHIVVIGEDHDPEERPLVLTPIPPPSRSGP